MTTAAHPALPAWMFEPETIYVRLSKKNGLARIATGELEDDVISGGWVSALARARQLRRMVVVLPNGYIHRVVTASLSRHAAEASAKGKQPRSRCWFDIADDPGASALIGQKSPLCRDRSPVEYGKVP